MTNEQRDETLTDLHIKVTELHGMADTNAKAIKILFHAIEGNGRQGLKQDVSQLKQVQMDCRDRLAKTPTINSNRIAVLALIVAVFVSPVLTLGVGIMLKKL